MWIERERERERARGKEGRVCGCITLIAGRGLSGEHSHEGREKRKGGKVAGGRPVSGVTKTESTVNRPRNKKRE